MSTFDTLQYNGIERTFASWGFSLSGVKGAKYNMREDVFRATVAGAHVSDDPVFPFEAQVIVRTGRVSSGGADNSFSAGTVKFMGKRVGLEGSATERSRH